MEVAAFYDELRGSRGQVHLQLPQSFLDDVCRLFEHQEVAYAGKIRRIQITPDKKRRQNCLRMQVELSRRFLQTIGEMLLHSFGDDGIEIHIDQACATPADPRILASFETRTAGIKLAETLVKEVNNALQTNNVIKLEAEGDWWNVLSPYKAILTLNPFFLLKRLIEVFPAVRKLVSPKMVDHLSHIELKTSNGCLHVDLIWQHVG